MLQSANRDEQEFPDADAFDIDRRPPRSLALGIGRHHCIGSHLARLEGRILLEALLTRAPEYEIDADSLVRAASEFQVGYTSMHFEL